VFDDGVRDERRRHVAFGDEHVEAVAGEHLGETLREALRRRPGVVADGDGLVAARRGEVVRDRLADDPHALVGELVERRPPAVGPE